MLKEKSAGAVIFRLEKGEINYLLLHKDASEHYKESWDFPKGWVEDGEEEQKTDEREVMEEAGLKKIEFVPGFKERVTYFYQHEKGRVFKEVIYFLAETKQKDVKVSSEHSSYRWFEYDDALKMATFSSSKNVLKKANEFLKEKMKQKTLRSFS